jgi:ketosteroid isomerase-like protein
MKLKRGPWLAAVGVLIGNVRPDVAGPPPFAQEERAAIEKLHRLDIEATLSDKADRLVELWDRDAVRLGDHGPAEVGRGTIYADDKQWEARNTGRSLAYKPDVKDLQIVGDWAFEWGYFEASSIDSPNAIPETVHGKQLRILKRQADGSWKFSRVMSLADRASTRK